jgi:hypothetical protein
VRNGCGELALISSLNVFVEGQSKEQWDVEWMTGEVFPYID